MSRSVFTQAVYTGVPGEQTGGIGDIVDSAPYELPDAVMSEGCQ